MRLFFKRIYYRVYHTLFGHWTLQIAELRATVELSEKRRRDDARRYQAEIQKIQNALDWERLRKAAYETTSNQWNTDCQKALADVADLKNQLRDSRIQAEHLRTQLQNADDANARAFDVYGKLEKRCEELTEAAAKNICTQLHFSGVVSLVNGVIALDGKSRVKAVSVSASTPEVEIAKLEKPMTTTSYLV